ncbi:MAG: metal ABC transporter substrate-binding protein [Candidatus Sumerlaeaceae bacterium]
MNTRYRIRMVLCFILTLVVPLPWALALTTSSLSKVTIVATIAPIADWVRNVGGDEVEVFTLVPPGTSPHTFEPSPSDLRTIARSQLIVAAGLGLDDWAIRLAGSNAKIRQIRLGDRLKEKGLLPADLPTPESFAVGEKPSAGTSTAEGHKHDEHAHHHDGADPHFWLDPVLGQHAVTEIEIALKEIAPEQGQKWQANAEGYRQKLAELDREIQQLLANCKDKRLVSFHNAFSYFARRYGLVVAGVIQAYPGKPPSEREIKKLVEELRAAGIKTIFSEPQMDTRLARIIAAEVGGTVGMLDPEGTAERSTYIELMRYNAQQVKNALCR